VWWGMSNGGGLGLQVRHSGPAVVLFDVPRNVRSKQVRTTRSQGADAASVLPIGTRQSNERGACLRKADDEQGRSTQNSSRRMAKPAPHVMRGIACIFRPLRRPSTPPTANLRPLCSAHLRVLMYSPRVW